MEAGPEATHGQQDGAGSGILFESFSLEKKREFSSLGTVQDERFLLDMDIMFNTWNIFFILLGEKHLFFMDKK